MKQIKEKLTTIIRYIKQYIQELKYNIDKRKKQSTSTTENKYNFLT